MKKRRLFDILKDGVEEMHAIEAGRKKPVRMFVYSPVKLKKIRKKLHVSQAQFSALLGISNRTLQNWEQGANEPTGAARSLLMIADKHPEVFREVLLAQSA